MVKKLPAMKESRVHSIPELSPCRRAWLPSPVFLPGEVHGQRTLVGYTVHGVSKSQT